MAGLALVRNDELAERQEAERLFNELDISETTRRDYQYRIGLFLKFIGGAVIKTNSYLNYKRYLADRTDFATATKNKYLITARVYLKELNKQGILQADITQNVKGFTQSKKHKRFGVNDTEIHAIAEAIKQLPLNASTARFRALFCLLAMQGLRQIEIIRLDVRDLDLGHRVAFIQGKGQDDKESVDLHPETVKALKGYLSISKIKDGALFVSLSNNSKDERLTTRAIRQIITEMLKGLGIEGTTHGFRHYFTTRLIKHFKGDILKTAKFTRHKSVETLQAYFDDVNRERDLPNYYNAFSKVSL